MIRHIITLIWNRRRSLAWIFAEQMLVFAVLLFVFIGQAEHIKRYYTKGYIRMDNIAIVGFDEFDRIREDQLDDENVARFHNMVERMRQWENVDLISISRNGAMPNTNHRSDTVIFNEQRIRANIRMCDENYYHMFSPILSEGQWFATTAHRIFRLR